MTFFNRKAKSLFTGRSVLGSWRSSSDTSERMLQQQEGWPWQGVRAGRQKAFSSFMVLCRLPTKGMTQISVGFSYLKWLNPDALKGMPSCLSFSWLQSHESCQLRWAIPTPFITSLACHKDLPFLLAKCHKARHPCPGSSWLRQCFISLSCSLVSPAQILLKELSKDKYSILPPALSIMPVSSCNPCLPCISWRMWEIM